MKKKLKELAEFVGGTVIGDGEVEISGVASLDEAGTGQITFIANPKYLRKLSETRASAVIVSQKVTSSDKPLICTANPHLAFVRILTFFFARPYQPKGIDPKAWVSSSAFLGKDLSIFPYVYLGDRCRIEDRVTLYPGVYVGEDASIGEDSVLHPNVTVYPGSIIGKRVILHGGVVIGGDGFGYLKDGTKNVKIPQVGRVILEDDVEIGPNSTIDRGALGDTIIRRGVKIDNLAQIAHNVEIGEDSIIVAQVGIAGSTKIGKNVVLAGQVGVAGHIEIGDNTMIGAQSGVGQSLPPNQIYSGSPAMPHREWLRMVMSLPKLSGMRKILTDIEIRLKRIEDTIHQKEKET